MIADETHLNAERQAMELDQIRGALAEYFVTMENVLGDATDAQLSDSTTSCWFPLRNHREDRSAQNLLEGLFLNHWRDHRRPTEGPQDGTWNGLRPNQDILEFLKSNLHWAK